MVRKIIMDDKKLAGSARRQIGKENKIKDAELMKELMRQERKMYWEDYRGVLYRNLKSDFYIGLGLSTTLAVTVRSVAIFPLIMSTYFTFEAGRTWIQVPSPTYDFKDD